jgi:cell division protein FtsB
MRRQVIVRVFLFVLFFSIGAAVLSGSVLCDDLLAYYQNKRHLRQSEELLESLKALNTDYDALLRQLEDDPNFVRRIARATLGTEPEDEDTAYPEVTAEQLDAARKILTTGDQKQTEESGVPDWIIRCSQPPQRTALFVSGAFLILISFICFAPREKTSPDHEQFAG